MYSIDDVAKTDKDIRGKDFTADVPAWTKRRFDLKQCGKCKEI